ncbi:MAG TPA: hypothetical protein VLZ11_07965 [Flavobacterium sp.]|nr:hypothetical protein [Flavobacterium sp.]
MRESQKLLKLTQLLAKDAENAKTWQVDVEKLPMQLHLLLSESIKKRYFCHSSALQLELTLNK